MTLLSQTAKSSPCQCLQPPGSSYQGLYDFSGFEGSKIAIFLSVLSGFEAQGKNFCDILVQLGGFEDKSGENFASWERPRGKSGPKTFLTQNLQGLSQVLAGHSVKNVTSLSEIADFRGQNVADLRPKFRVFDVQTY